MRMRSLLAAFAALTTLGLTPLDASAAEATPTSTQNGYSFNLDTVKFISCETKDGDLVSGTGVAVFTKDRVLTANHVVQDAKACKIDGVAATVIWHDDSGDVAVLQAALGDGPIAQVSCDGYTIGSLYISFGYAYGKDFAMQMLTALPETMGMASNMDYPFNTRPAQLLVGEVHHGMSGGPILGLDGRVVGINNASDGRSSLSRPLSDTALCVAFKLPPIPVAAIPVVKLAPKG